MMHDARCTMHDAQCTMQYCWRIETSRKGVEVQPRRGWDSLIWLLPRASPLGVNIRDVPPAQGGNGRMGWVKVVVNLGWLGILGGVMVSRKVSRNAKALLIKVREQ